MRHLIAAVLVLLATSGPSQADAPSLPFSQESAAEEYFVRFTNEDDHAFPVAQGLQAADAIDRSGNDVPGNPKGYHDGYVDIGFLEPYFSGTKVIDVWDCKNDDDTPCDNGSANNARIRVPTSVYSTLYPGSWANEMCLRRMLGHELFHHVEYGYSHEAGGTHCGNWGDASCEGHARMMQDQIYSDLDLVAHSCNSAQGAFDSYLNNPNRTIWDISYTSALFWKYLAEQFGNVTIEPERGSDFIREWWENSIDDYDTPDIVQLTRHTIQEFGGVGVDAAFHDFTIANAAKDYDLSPLSNADEERWSYDDEAQGFMQPDYAGVPSFFAHVEPGFPWNAPTIVLEYGATYPGAEVEECGFGSFLHFDVEPAVDDLVSLGVMSLILIDNNGEVYDVDKKVGTTWHWTQTQGIPNADQVQAVFGALGNVLIASYEFRCGYPLDVDFPLTNGPRPTAGGPPGTFGLIAVDMDVQDERGRVVGLEPESFAVSVGPAGTALPARVLAKLETPLGDRLLVRAPDGLATGAHRLAVETGTLDASADGVVLRGDRLPDQILLFDRSQSMATAVGGTTRFAIAQRAAAFVVGGAPDGSQLGIVSFAGNGSEPNDDSEEELALDSVTSAHRSAALAALAGIDAPSGPTSIGDGLLAAARTFELAGAGGQERHVFLLSDGGESEAAGWPAARAAILASGARVHAIALGANTDQGLLAEIATETDGSFQFVDLSPAGTLPSRLGDAFRRAADRANGRQRFFETERALTVSETAVLPIEVEAGLESMRVVVDWDDAAHGVGTTLRAPDGSVQPHFNPKEFHIHLPAAGVWQLEVTALAGAPTVHVAGAGDSFNGKYLVTGVSHRYDAPAVGRTGGFASAAPLAIQAAFVDASGPILGATAEADVEHPDGSHETLALFDDGREADAVADNGVYSATYHRTTAFSVTGLPETVPGSRGSHRVAFTMFEADGTPVRHDALSFWVGQGPTGDADADGLLDRYEAIHRCLASSAPSQDPDGDRRTSAQELAAGTDPCDSDSDDGGENDGSEIARGAKPGDPRDDALPAPGWFSIVTKINELHVPDDPRFVPQPLANLLRVPSAREYTELLIERRAHPDFLWQPIGRPDPRSLGGAFLDAGLPEGATYDYRMRGVDAAGNESAVSRILSATVKQDPLAPIGALRIDHGPRTDDDRVDLLIDLYLDDPADIEMRLSTPAVRATTFGPYAAQTTIQLPLVLEPTPAVLTATLRDLAGNESLDYSESILVYPLHSLGSIRGTADRVGPDGGGALVVQLAGRPEERVELSAADGSFVLDDLLPGTYTVELADDAVSGRITGVVVDPGAETDVGTVLAPEPGALAVALAALAALAARRRAAYSARSR